jgi:hypothetical protein
MTDCITQAYTLLRPHWSIRAGKTVFKLKGWDYGCASDDSRATGEKHISITLNPDGSPPGYSVPMHDLEEIKP